MLLTYHNVSELGQNSHLTGLSAVQIWTNNHIDGLVQDCSNSIANAQELLQSCTKPPIYSLFVNGTRINRWIPKSQWEYMHDPDLYD